MVERIKQQRTNAVKCKAGTKEIEISRIEVGLVCDEGTSPAGLHGLNDLFTYASDLSVKRKGNTTRPTVRLTHWRTDHERGEVYCTFDSCPSPDHNPSVLVLPGNLQATLGTTRDEVLIHWLRLKHSQGVVLAAVCGGVFILAKTGLLDGRRATTHWALSDQFAAQFPDVLTETDFMVIDYGDVLTAGGVLAWADLGLRITERFLGPTVMLETARYMNVDPPGREQRFYSDFDPRTKHGDRAILRAQHWLSTQRERAVTVGEIAKQSGLEPRTFLRRFAKATGMKPIEYQQQLRISRARELLEFSRESVDKIASSVGYDDVGGFRRIFRRIMGLTPSDYRKRFSRNLINAVTALDRSASAEVRSAINEET